jgi:hypothetical protein
VIDLAFWVGMIVAVEPALPEGAKDVALYVVYRRNCVVCRRNCYVLRRAFLFCSRRLLNGRDYRSVFAASPALLRF